jgi:hypothetical protein
LFDYDGLLSFLKINEEIYARQTEGPPLARNRNVRRDNIEFYFFLLEKVYVERTKFLTNLNTRLTWTKLVFN